MAHQDKQRRRENAASLQAEREARGDAAQLRHLEERGFGNCKEASRLRVRLSGGDPEPIVGVLEVEE